MGDYGEDVAWDVASADVDWDFEESFWSMRESCCLTQFEVIASLDGVYEEFAAI